MFFQSGFSNAIDLLDDSDEEKSAKQDFILACSLDSEFLSEKKKDQHFTSEKGLSGKYKLKSWL